MSKVFKRVCIAGFVATQCYCFWHSVTKYVGFVTYCRGDSMEPTIRDGDICLVETRSIRSRRMSIGDVVVAQRPFGDSSLCKRLRAVEGDVVRYQQLDSGDVKETYVPTNHIWLEGDNAAHSYDSRAFGPIHYKFLMCRVAWRIYPLSRWGPLQNDTTIFKSERIVGS